MSDARELEDQARAITDALLSSARAAVARVERALFVRTGPQGTEYRDAAGSVAAAFLQHTSREGDPQLHVHIAVMNLAQRGDQADARWRTLHGAMLYQERLAVAAYAARELATRLTDLGYVLVPREDGNGFEVGGVDQAVKDAFSSRRAQITPEVARMAEEYRQRYGREPSRRTLWAMAQAATLETRKAKSRGRSDRSGQPDRTAGDELDEWEARTTERELGTLSGVHEAVRSFARPEGLDAPAELDGPARGRALSGALSPRPSATPRPLPARPCCGRSTWPCRPWRQGWTRRPWPRSWRTRRWPLLRSWRWDRRRTWWTCPRWARGPVTAGPCSPTQGPSGTPRQASWTWRSGSWPRRAARWPSSPRRTRRTWPWRARASARTRPRWPPGSSRRGPPCPCWWPQRARARHTSWPRTRGPGRRITGGRVVGVTLSTNAANVMATEGLAEAYNVAQALGRREDGSTGRQLELGVRDVLVIDEASQVSTEDLAALVALARRTGARLVLVGDTAQLGAVEAGGMMRLIGSDLGHWELAEVHRFDAEWEALASLQLRQGARAALRAYDARGRIRGAHEAEAERDAVALYLADHLMGRDSLLLAGTNEEAAKLAGMVRAELARLGRVPQPHRGHAGGRQRGRAW